MLAVVLVVGIFVNASAPGVYFAQHLGREFCERREASETDSLESEMINSKCRAEGEGHSVADVLGRSLFRRSFVVTK